MKAVVFHGVGDIRLDDVPDPTIQEPTDAVIRITSSAICGTDLHMVRGTFSGMEPGSIVGHEAVGVVEELGSMVRNLSVGDRVVVMSTIACGSCAYCRAGYYSQCDNCQSERQSRRDGLLRRSRGNRAVQWPAGREGAYPLRQHRPREAAGRGGGRAGDHDLGHLPHRLLRGRGGGDRGGRHRRRLRLRPGRAVRDRLGQADRAPAG